MLNLELRNINAAFFFIQRYTFSMMYQIFVVLLAENERITTVLTCRPVAFHQMKKKANHKKQNSRHNDELKLGAQSKRTSWRAKR